MSKTTITANQVVVPSLLLAGAIAAATLALSGIANAADEKVAMEKCYGVSKAGKNDCQAGAHGCAGQATKDRDPASFVALPKGLCEKLAGGNLMPKQG